MERDTAISPEARRAHITSCLLLYASARSLTPLRLWYIANNEIDSCYAGEIGGIVDDLAQVHGAQRTQVLRIFRDEI